MVQESAVSDVNPKRVVNDPQWLGPLRERVTSDRRPTADHLVVGDSLPELVVAQQPIECL